MKRVILFVAITSLTGAGCTRSSSETTSASNQVHQLALSESEVAATSLQMGSQPISAVSIAATSGVGVQDASSVANTEAFDKNQQRDAIQKFRQIAAAETPSELFQTEGIICEGFETEKCRKDFLAGGAAWTGDVNNDGQNELLLRSVYSGGSAGEAYFIFQKRKDSWVSLSPPGSGDILTITGTPRFDILPIVRDSYHDIRIDAVGCFKWDGKAYVPYETEDWHKLQSSWFDFSKFDEAELFWDIRYQGAKQIMFEPQWFPGVPKWSSNVELDDTQLGLRWLATFKGGVYAVQKDKSFLLVPHPTYGGAEKLEIQGDWLVASAKVQIDRVTNKWELRPIARYNRRTGELHIQQYN
jgi:hypothetical protein